MVVEEWRVLLWGVERRMRKGLVKFTYFCLRCWREFDTRVTNSEEKSSFVILHVRRYGSKASGCHCHMVAGRSIYLAPIKSESESICELLSRTGSPAGRSGGDLFAELSRVFLRLVGIAGYWYVQTLREDDYNVYDTLIMAHRMCSGDD